MNAILPRVAKLRLWRNYARMELEAIRERQVRLPGVAEGPDGLNPLLF